MSSQNLHPHWQPMEEEVVQVRAKQPAPHPFAAPKTVSRRPAAIAGIAIVSIAGFYFFGGMDLINVQMNKLTGQVAASAITVRITETGMQPDTLEVSAGDTITFTNDSATPHILESDSFCSETGYCFTTQTLFPGESENYTITKDFPAGTYSYNSAMNEEISGEVTVRGTQIQTALPTTTHTEQEYTTIDEVLDQATQGTGVFDPTPQTTADNTSTADLQGAINEFQNLFGAAPEQTAVTAQASIPQNPYVVGNGSQRPFDDSPIQELSGSNNLHAGAPKPIRQPDTGPGLWIVIGMSITGIGLFARRQFAAVTLYQE